MARPGSQSDGLDNSPIDLLPPEILGEIFGLTITACMEAYDLDRLSYVTWYNFTFVSRHWRLVAINTPDIWSTLLFHSWGTVSLMLERSKMADLAINVNVYSIFPLVKRVINEHTSRIAAMSLMVGQMGFSNLLAGLDERPPSLRLREIRLYRTIGNDQFFPNSILLPDRLQVLEAHGFNFAWEPLQSFPCLTHLTIGSTDLRVSLADFITALRGMPALEFLHLRNSLPSEPPFAPVQPAHVTKLRQLHITSTQGPSQISYFLPLITVPPTTNIRIRCVCNFRRRSIAVAEISAFTSSLHSLIRGMHLEDDDSDSCHYKSIWVSPTGDGLKIAASMTDLEKDWPIAMDFELTVCGYDPEDTIQEILPAFPQDKILSLRLEIGYRSEILLELSDSLPRLRHATLFRESMPNFIAVLTLEKQLYPFQNLRDLTLDHATFSSRNHYGLEACELQQCLEERSRSGAKLEKLNLILCSGIYEHDIQRLRDVVEVEWDGTSALVKVLHSRNSFTPYLSVGDALPMVMG